MAQLTIAFHTLGCKTNQYETDALRTRFRQAGFAEVPFSGIADVYLVNTCTVTGEADRKSRQLLRRARRINPRAIIAAVGCHVELNQTDGLADIRIGTAEKGQVLAAVLAELGQRRDAGPQQANRSTYEELGPVDRQSETRAYVKIEDGCDSFCAYCAIPLARGRVRSRPRQAVLAEVRALAAAGYREIVLTGIHVCSYGADWGLPGHAVAELALELECIDGIARIRLGSLEPQSVTDRFVELARRNSKLMPHFHVSLQSGSDTVLARMGRAYNTQDYRAVAARLREAFGQPKSPAGSTPGLSTDIMVGFPGESEAEHETSLAFCHEIGFSRMHVFPYSSRPGTAAAAMPDPVHAVAIRRRSQAMLTLADELALDFHRRQTGRRLEVLLEEARPDGFFAGYTPEYAPVRVETAPGLAAGQIAAVDIVAAERDFLLCSGANSGKSCYHEFECSR